MAINPLKVRSSRCFRAGCATCVDWDQYLVDHPEDRQQLESLVTMVVGMTP